jgi:hypothetical protein
MFIAWIIASKATVETAGVGSFSLSASSEGTATLECPVLADTLAAASSFTDSSLVTVSFDGAPEAKEGVTLAAAVESSETTVVTPAAAGKVSSGR